MGRIEALAVTTLAVFALLAVPPPAGAQCDPKNDRGHISAYDRHRREDHRAGEDQGQIEKEHDIMITIFRRVGVRGPHDHVRAGRRDVRGPPSFEGRLDPRFHSRANRDDPATTNIYPARLHPAGSRGRARHAWSGLSGTAPPAPRRSRPPFRRRVADRLAGSHGLDRGERSRSAGAMSRSAPAIETTPRSGAPEPGGWSSSGTGRCGASSATACASTPGMARSRPTGRRADCRARATRRCPPRLDAQFQRSGVDLLISSHKLDLMAASRGPASDPRRVQARLHGGGALAERAFRARPAPPARAPDSAVC